MKLIKSNSREHRGLSFLNRTQLPGLYPPKDRLSATCLPAYFLPLPQQNDQNIGVWNPHILFYFILLDLSPHLGLPSGSALRNHSWRCLRLYGLVGIKPWSVSHVQGEYRTILPSKLSLWPLKPMNVKWESEPGLDRLKARHQQGWVLHARGPLGRIHFWYSPDSWGHPCFLVCASLSTTKSVQRISVGQASTLSLSHLSSSRFLSF